jgi:hypothetical protein
VVVWVTVGKPLKELGGERMKYGDRKNRCGDILCRFGHLAPPYEFCVRSGFKRIPVSANFGRL